MDTKLLPQRDSIRQQRRRRPLSGAFKGATWTVCAGALIWILMYCFLL